MPSGYDLERFAKCGFEDRASPLLNALFRGQGSERLGTKGNHQVRLNLVQVTLELDYTLHEIYLIRWLHKPVELVLWWTLVADVRNEAIAPGDASRVEHTVEQLTGAAYEGLP